MTAATKTNNMNNTKSTTDRTNRRLEGHEVLLIKLNSNDDVRTSDEIKNKVMDLLKNKKSVLKIKGIRQLQSKGVLMKVSAKEDVEIMKKTNLFDYGLNAMTPKKHDPNIIIYDVNNEYKVDELKADFINKNFSQEQKQEIDKISKQINFKFCFKNRKTARVN